MIRGAAQGVEVYRERYPASEHALTTRRFHLPCGAESASTGTPNLSCSTAFDRDSSTQSSASEQRVRKTCDQPWASTLWPSAMSSFKCGQVMKSFDSLIRLAITKKMALYEYFCNTGRA